LSKLIKLAQNNTLKLDEVLENQEKFELMMNEQKVQISDLKSRLESHTMEVDATEAKGRKKGKYVEKNEFYQVSI
jgi:hypothetical protein